jgi:hypothetical protein
MIAWGRFLGIAFTLAAGILASFVATTALVGKPLFGGAGQVTSTPLLPATQGPAGQQKNNQPLLSEKQRAQLTLFLAQQLARGSKTVCGMTVVPADPTIDPKMRISKSDGNSRMPLVPPQMCRGTLSPSPTVPPAGK